MKKVHFFILSKWLKISALLKKFKNSCYFSFLFVCHFKKLHYLCTRFREAMRQRDAERVAI